MRRTQVGGRAGFSIVYIFFFWMMIYVGVFARNLRVLDLWLSGCSLFVNWCSNVDIFTVEETVIYLSI